MRKVKANNEMLPPSIPMLEGRRRLATLLDQGQELLRQRPMTEGQEEIWSNSCLKVIDGTFGDDSAHRSTFIGQIRVIFSTGDEEYDHYAEKRDAKSVERRCGVLTIILKQMDLEIGFIAAPQPQLNFWSDLHPKICSVAKPRFESGHFADAVEAALKELNAIVKEYVRRKTRTELDGAPLMLKAFSANNPVVALDDLSTETGRNIQQGYMQMYAGAMTGIRNPKAHANIVIDGKRARHHLYVASLLTYRFDERL
ncbi:TIGR02391 family protein [Verrucomicrobiota bacterium]